MPRGPSLGLPCPSHRGLWGGRFRLAGAPLSETPCGQTRTQSRVPGRGAGAVGRGRPFQNFLVVGAGRGFSGSLGLSREISEQVHVTAPPCPAPPARGGGVARPPECGTLEAQRGRRRETSSCVDRQGAVSRVPAACLLRAPAARKSACAPRICRGEGAAETPGVGLGGVSRVT